MTARAAMDEMGGLPGGPVGAHLLLRLPMHELAQRPLQEKEQRQR